VELKASPVMADGVRGLAGVLLDRTPA